MTVSSETAKSGPYTGNGVTTVFAYEFRVLDAGHITVIRTVGGIDSVVSPAEFTVSGVGDVSGNVTFAVAPVAGQSITIIRNAPFTQEVDLENQGAYYAETVEEAFDLAAMRDQQLQEQIDRSVKIPVGADPSSLDEVISDVIRLTESVDNIDTVAGISADVITVAGISGDVSTVANIALDVTTVSNISTAVSTVAANDANVFIVAGSIGGVNTVAASIVNVNTVAGSIAAVNAVSASISNVNTVAGSIASVNTVSGSIASVNTVSASISGVNTVAGIAADVVTVAANLADVTNFADVYLGPAASNPATRNDGSALVSGDLFFNTSAGQMRVFDGAAWIAASSAVNGTTKRQSFTATAGQTVFAITGGYDAGFADVYLNGVKLVNGVDVDVSSGTDVTLAVGAGAGDSVDVVAYGAFEVADTYSQAEVDALLAAKASLTGAENLTNKTLTNPVLNGTVTGTALSSTPDAQAGTGTGIMNSTLTAQAIAAQETVTLLSRTVISGSPAVIDFVFNQTLYDEVFFVFQGVGPETGGSAQNLSMRTSPNGGPSFSSGATDYRWSMQGRTQTGVARDAESAGAPELRLTNGGMVNTTGGQVFGNLRLYGAGMSDAVTRFTADFSYGDNGSLLCKVHGGGQRFAVGIVNAVRFFFPTGNFANDGIITMYGVRNS